MAWFNLTPMAKIFLGATVAEGALSAINKNTQSGYRPSFSKKTPEQYLAMAKIVANSEWAKGRSHEEVNEFCKTLTDDKYIKMFGPIPSAENCAEQPQIVVAPEKKSCLYCGTNKNCYYCLNNREPTDWTK